MPSIITLELNASLSELHVDRSPELVPLANDGCTLHHACRLTVQLTSASIDAMRLRSAFVATCQDLVVKRISELEAKRLPPSICS